MLQVVEAPSIWWLEMSLDFRRIIKNTVAAIGMTQHFENKNNYYKANKVIFKFLHLPDFHSVVKNYQSSSITRDPRILILISV